MQYPAGFSHVHMLITYVNIVNYYLNTKYLSQLCDRCIFVLENFHRSVANLVAQSIDGTTKRLMCCKERLIL